MREHKNEMNHPFPSQKSIIAESERVLQIMDDVRCLCGITRDECEHIRTRTEVEIPDESERKESILRNSSRLGVLLRDVDDATSNIGIDLSPKLSSKHSKTWRDLIRDGSSTDVSSMLTDLDSRTELWRVRRDACMKNENVDGNASSSYSDYSDDSTETSDEEDSGNDRSSC